MGDRREQLTAETTARMRATCAHFPADEFAALIAAMVDVRLKYERLRSDYGRPPDPPPPRAD